MGFVRKHFAWIIAGIVLLAEGGAVLFVAGARSEARAALERLEAKRAERDKLKRDTQGIEKRIEQHKARRKAAEGEQADCVVFLWHLGQPLEGLFESPKLAEYGAYPWHTPARFEVFKAAYQEVYNAEADKLAPVMEEVGTDPGALGLAARGAFSQASVLIGDIFALQKEFTVKKTLLGILAKWHVRLDSLFVGGGTAGAVRRGHAPVVRAAEGPSLAEPIPVQMAITCDYTHLGDLLEDLATSPLCFRVIGIQSIQRARADVAGPALREPTPKGAADAERPEGDEGAGPLAARARRQAIAVALSGEIPDILVEVQQVTFAKAQFPKDRADVVAWLGAQLRKLDDARKRLELPRAKGADPKAPPPQRPELALDWIAKQLDRVRQADTEAGKTVSVTDALCGREYAFASLKDAQTWLERRYDYERLRLEATRALLQRTRKLIEAGIADHASKVGTFVGPEGVQAVFRPEDHLDKAQTFDIELGTGVRAKFGLLAFKPVESREGVARATGTVRR